MKLLCLSDLHFEFHDADSLAAFARSLPDASEHGIDAVVIAGDLAPVRSKGIAVDRCLRGALGFFCDRYPLVIFVAGNHEMYGSSPATLFEKRSALAAQDRFANLRWLEKDVLALGDTRILGTTMWFPPTRNARAMQRLWSDFVAIDEFESFVYEENARCVAFLRREVREGDVVVTHYLPSFRSVHPRYAAEPTNCFYVSDAEDVIVERRPRLWLHGHTHESMDYSIGPTRVLCNPYGYQGHERNGGFDGLLIVDV